MLASFSALIPHFMRFTELWKKSARPASSNSTSFSTGCRRKIRCGGDNCCLFTLISSTWLTMISARRSTWMRTLPMSELACVGVNTK